LKHLNFKEGIVMTKTRGTFIKGKIAVLMAVVMVFGVLGFSNVAVYGTASQPVRRATVTVDGVASTHDLVSGTNSLNASGIDFTIENEANAFVIYLGAVRVTGNTTARTSTTINGRRVEIVVNTERNSGGQSANSQPTATNPTSPTTQAAPPSTTTQATASDNTAIMQAYLLRRSDLAELTNQEQRLYWRNHMGSTRSSITLPNRRLTDAERQAWIDEYHALGGLNDFELEVVHLINEIRYEHGLSLVEIDIISSMAARFHAQTINQFRPYGFTSMHNAGPYATDPNASHGASVNAKRAFGGTPAWNGGNSSSGANSPQNQIQRWMNSDGHRRYILSPGWSSVGVGAAGAIYLFFN
jgi:uncharacterized protein YkwD